MRGSLVSILAVGSLLIAPATRAQDGAGSPSIRSADHDPARFAGAHLMTPRGRERLNDLPGTFVSDPRTRRLTFEVDGATVFETPYDRVTALHYEPNKFPQRAFGRASHYLVIEATRADGGSVIQAIRWSSNDDAQRACDRVAQDAERRVERTKANRSLLGLGIRLATGDFVYVTDRTGRREKGRLPDCLPRR